MFKTEPRPQKKGLLTKKILINFCRSEASPCVIAAVRCCDPIKTQKKQVLSQKDFRWLIINSYYNSVKKKKKRFRAALAKVTNVRSCDPRKSNNTSQETCCLFAVFTHTNVCTLYRAFLIVKVNAAAHNTRYPTSLNCPNKYQRKIRKFKRMTIMLFENIF